MQIGAATHVGKIREMNEDNYYIPKDVTIDIPLFIVADGMGGTNAGEIASSLAIYSAAYYISKCLKKNTIEELDIAKLMTESITYANEIIYEKAKESDEFEGMGTTIDMVMIQKDRLYIAHVGDSRVYSAKKSGLKQLTKDHSYIQQLVERGVITEEQAVNHPSSNIITRALGTEENIEIDIVEKRLYKEETIILCTDGLTKMVSDQKIYEITQSISHVQQIAEKLVQEANSVGGNDNITAIVIRK
jgi:protein phosphatase